MPEEQVDERKKYIEGKAEEIIAVLKGVAVTDIGPIFSTAQMMILERTKI